MSSHTPHGPRARFNWRPTPVVLRLIIVNVGIWLLFSVLVHFLEQPWAWALHHDHLALDAHNYFTSFELWQVFTYMWLHDLLAASHIIFNMLGLYFLGPPLERRWGGRHFLRFYVLTGTIAGIFSLLAGHVLPATFGIDVVIGASGAVLGLVAAFSIVIPNTTLLLFFVVPLRAKYVVWIVLAIDTVVFLSATTSDVAYQTHVGGVIAAWLLITGNWRPRLAFDRLRLLRLKLKRRQARARFNVIKGGKDDDKRHLN